MLYSNNKLSVLLVAAVIWIVVWILTVFRFTTPTVFYTFNFTFSTGT